MKDTIIESDYRYTAFAIHRKKAVNHFSNAVYYMARTRDHMKIVRYYLTILGE